jgi:Pirin C-terminal cupin domain
MNTVLPVVVALLFLLAVFGSAWYIAFRLRTTFGLQREWLLRVEGQPLQERVLYYLGANRSAVCFTSRSGGRLPLVGGPPFPEKILMWWNFVARTPQEIADARTDWEERRRFGDVTGYSGPRLGAGFIMAGRNRLACFGAYS